MQVLLIHPNFDTPLGVSIGIAYLAAALRRAGHEVDVIHINEQLDYPYDLERITADVRQSGAQLVGIGTGHNHYPEMQEVVKAVGGGLGIPVVLGGIHPTLNADQVIQENPDLTYVCIGEGEEAAVELADALESGGDTTKIENIFARVDGTIHRNRVRPFLDMKILPDMANDVWDFQKITDLRRGWVNISTQRGCPYRCSYCHNNGVTQVLAEHMGRKSWGNADLEYLRYRPVDDMVAELRSIRDQYELTAFSFIDDTFTMNRPWLKQFLEAYQREVDLPFVCNTTANDLDDATVALLAKSGCRVIRLGVESGSLRLVTDLLRRQWVAKDKIRWAFRTIQEHGMHALAFNMIGNVGETREETLSTFQFNAELQPTSIRLSIAYPYPGTQYEETARGSDAIDPLATSHNYLSRSILKQDQEHEIWLDKVRSFYFWYINRFLANESSEQFAALVERLEGLTADEWQDSTTQAQLQQEHAQLSEKLQASGVFHYTTPFSDRPDIVVSSRVVAEHAELIRREAAEPH